MKSGTSPPAEISQFSDFSRVESFESLKRLERATRLKVWSFHAISPRRAAEGRHHRSVAGEDRQSSGKCAVTPAQQEGRISMEHLATQKRS